MISLGTVTGVIVTIGEILLDQLFSQIWTIVDSKTGEEILTFKSFLDASIVDETKIASEAVEEGSFASYNKVDTPLEIKVTLGLTGSTTELQDALDQLEKYVHSTDLINLVTPIVEYENLNLTRYDFDLKRDLGLGALYISLILEEVRQVKAEYTNVTVAPLQKRGTVQGKKVTKSSASTKNSAGNKSLLRQGFNGRSKSIASWLVGK